MLILQQHLTLVTTINTQGGGKKKKSHWQVCLAPASALLPRLPLSSGSAPAQARLALTPGAAFKAARGEEEGSRMTGR